MTNTINAYIRPSSKFQGKYEVVREYAKTCGSIEQEIIPCYNLSTARSYVEGTREYAIVNGATQSPATAPSIQCIGFLSPSGQYYAVVEMPDMDVRIDCHNEATLRGWMKNGVGFSPLIEALRDERNVRRRGGWNA